MQPDGSLVVVFGRHAHRLAPDLAVLASVTLPREAPYNSFVTLPDGHLVTKDFGGLLPGQDEVSAAPAAPAELVVLDPVTLEIVASCEVAEPSIARLSADGDTVYVVGDHSLLRAHWDGSDLVADDAFAARYRTIPGQTHGWDAVLALGAAWFLDDGAGAERYAGTFRGVGTNTAPLHLVRVDLATAAVQLTEVCGRPGGLIANPPLVDEQRRIVVGYDSGNGGDGRPSTSPPTARSRRAGPSTRITPAICSTTLSAACSSAATTTPRPSPRIWWCATSRPATRWCVVHPAARSSRCCSRRRASAAAPTPSRSAP